MRGRYWVCDRCGKREDKPDGLFGLFKHQGWIVVERSSASSFDLIQSGDWDFCSDHCLQEHLKERETKINRGVK